MEDYPVYQGTLFLGYMSEDYCRKLLRDQQARLVRRGQDRKIILNANTTLRIRLLNTGHAAPALSTVQTEEVYTGHRKNADGSKNSVVVTGRVKVLKKYRPGIGFVSWTDTDTFSPHRFNPDHMRSPLYARTTRRCP